MKCDKCGLESPLDELFVRRRASFRRRVRCLCPRCVSHFRDSVQAFSAILGALGAALVLLAWTFSPETAALPGLWEAEVVFLLPAFVGPGIALHELGHAIAGRIAGFEVGHICLGRGRQLRKWMLGGVTIEIRAIPVAGFVLAATTKMRLWRQRRLFLIAAGPAANLAISLATMGLALNVRTPFPTGQTSELPVFFWAVAAANLLLVLESMLGRMVTTSKGTIRSDGQQLVALIVGKMPTIQQRSYQDIQMRALWMIDGGRCPDAMSTLRAGLERYPSDIQLQLTLSYAQIVGEEYLESRETLLRLMAQHKKADATRAVIANNLAWADLMLEFQNLIEEADLASAEAYVLTPWVSFIQCTRGFLLVETGRSSEGLPLLNSALRGADTISQRASVQCCLAIAHCRLGDTATAESLIFAAEKKGASSGMVARARKVLMEFDESTTVRP